MELSETHRPRKERNGPLRRCKTNGIVHDPLAASNDAAPDGQQGLAGQGEGIVAAELTRRQLSYADLASRLQVIGVEEDPRNIKNKIGRGSFTAAFFFRCTEAIGVHTIHLRNGN